MISFTDQLLMSEAGARRPAATRYIIACAPRSGSTLLAAGLARSGLAGNPEEFFEEKVFARVSRELGVATEADYIPKLVEATASANGIFGTKLFWFHLNRFISSILATADIPANTPIRRIVPGLFEVILGSPLHYVWLRRHNKVAQAVSLYRAQSTDVWHQPTDSAADRALQFDFDRIDAHVRNLTRNEACWGSYFQRHQIEPLEVLYEEFVRSYEETLANVLRFLQLPVADAVITPPPLQRQANGRSLEWEALYRELTRRRMSS